jgi:hypothetical protein
MLRFAPVALAALLLVSTAAAFVYTEKLKLTPNPILGPRVDKVFSPVCECRSGVARISFRLREGDRISVGMVDGDGDPVRELVRNRRVPRGRVTVIWDGRDDAGAVVPEGRYRPRVRLLEQRRTITLPNPIRVDVTPPRFEAFSARPRRISPDGDGRRERVVARYQLSEKARVSLYVDGVRRGQKLRRDPEGAIRWYGRVDGVPVPAGTYSLTLGARDVAGNAASRPRPAAVLVRYVVLGRERIETRPGARFAVLVLSDAARVEWRLGARSGFARPGTLRLLAPPRQGRFTLTVSANGFAARAAVVVRDPDA